MAGGGWHPCAGQARQEVTQLRSENQATQSELSRANSHIQRLMRVRPALVAWLIDDHDRLSDSLHPHTGFATAELQGREASGLTFSSTI